MARRSKFLPASFRDPYPSPGSRLHRISGFTYEAPLVLVRAIGATRLRGDDDDASYIVGQDFTVSFKLESALPDSADYGVRKVTVPAGMLTDLASVPSLFRGIVGRTGPHLEASIVHDFLYVAWQDTNRGATEPDRLFADSVFDAGMIVSGVDSRERRLIHAAVRQYGWPAYAGINPVRYVDLRSVSGYE